MEFDVGNFLKDKVIPAKGCTEPIAVSLAVSLAYHASQDHLPGFLGGSSQEIAPARTEELEKISIKIDKNTFKNGYAVYIPNTGGEKGIKIAAAMGLFYNPERKLEGLQKVNKKVKEKAKKLVEEHKVKVKVKESKEPELFIEVNLKYAGKNSQARIEKEHTNVTLVKSDENILFEREKGVKEEKEFPEEISRLIEIAQNLTPEEKKEVYKGIKMNEKAIKEGLENKHGLKVGKTLQNLIEEDYLEKNLITEVEIQAGAAEDARVGGANIPVMSTSGSGSQGITATVPIIVTAKRNGYDKNKLIESVMISHLVNKYVNNYVGYLSPLCGCAIKASLGATAGVAYYLGGDEEKINNAINILAANSTGIICDGAKESCALKVCQAAGWAVKSALMALKGMKVKSGNGIIEKRAQDTIKNIGRIGEKMTDTDSEIVKIIQK